MIFFSMKKEVYFQAVKISIYKLHCECYLHHFFPFWSIVSIVRDYLDKSQTWHLIQLGFMNK